MLIGPESKVIRVVLAFSLWIIAFGAEANEVKELEANGVKAWVIEDSSLPIVSIRMTFRHAGNAYDAPESLGLAYFTAGMLNEGAGEFSSQDFQKELEENAIGFSPDVDKDNFYISVKTLTENLPKTLRMVNVAVTEPHFNEDDFERVKSQMLTIITKNSEDGGYIARRELENLIFKDHPYSQVKEGTTETVGQMAPEDLHKYARNSFAKDNLVIAIVGDVDDGGAENIISALTHNLPAKSTQQKEIAAVTNFPFAQVVEQKINNPQTDVYFAMPGIARNDENFYSAYVLNYIIGGGGFSTRLMKEVREKGGLAYFVGTDLFNYEKANIWIGTVSTKNDVVDKSIGLIKNEFAKLAKGGIEANEMKDAKSYIIGSFGLNMDTNDKLAAFLTSMQIFGLPIDYLEKRNDYFKKVTIKEVNELAQSLVKPQNLVFSKAGL